MNITDLIAQAGGLGSVAQELGVDEATALRGATALLPALVGGLHGKDAASPGAGGGLGALLEGLGGAALASSVLQPGPTDVTAGNGLLGHLFGSKDASRTVAADAAEKSGLPVDLLKKMLPLLAMLVAGYMAKQGGREQSGGGLGGMLGSLLGGGANPLESILGKLGGR